MMTSFILSASRHRISRLPVKLLPLSLANGIESCARQDRSHSKILAVSSINQNLERLRYEVRGTVAKRADERRDDLKVCSYAPYS